MRSLRLPSLLLPVLLVAGLSAATQATPASDIAPATVPAATASSWQPTGPLNAAVYYAVQSASASRVHPGIPKVVEDAEYLQQQVKDMQYAGQHVGLYSWFGRFSYPDRVLPLHLRAADDTSFRWAVLDENEGVSGPNGGDPTVSEIRADLDHIYGRYGNDPSYLRIGGKPVVFAYGDAGDTCNVPARWRQADSLNRFHIVLKTVPGYTGCSPQPQGWYGYAPANGTFRIGAHSLAVSPGFHKVGESAPRLARSLSRFTADLKAMKAANVRWKITTTWNEWLEATGVERASEWASASGRGTYVDAMHAVLGSAFSTPDAPTGLTASPSPSAPQQVDVRWSTATGSPTSFYRVFRNGCQVASVAGTSWSDTSLQDTGASYHVQAVGTRGTSRRSGYANAAAGSPAPAPPTTAGGLVAVDAVRLLDTTTSRGIGCSGRQRGQLQLALPATVPAGANGVVLSVTAFGSLGTGGVQVSPADGPATSATQLRYHSTRASSTTMVVPIGTGRQLQVQESGAATHLYVDLLGYTKPGVSGGFVKRGNRQQLVFFNSGSGGGAPIGPGTFTIPLPSYVPADATAVQVRSMIHTASAAGYAVVYPAAAAKPDVVSSAYAAKDNLTTNLLVRVDGSRALKVYLPTKTHLILGVEGWVSPTATRLFRPLGPQVLATPGRVTAVTVTLPSSLPIGSTAALSIGVSAPLGYGTAQVYAPTELTPQLQTLSYGPQQPQSSLALVTVQSDRKVTVQLSSAAFVYVDLLGQG